MPVPNKNGTSYDGTVGRNIEVVDTSGKPITFPTFAGSETNRVVLLPGDLFITANHRRLGRAVAYRVDGEVIGQLT